jgi:hypothetical protein
VKRATLEAQAFVLRDSQGNERGRLGCTEEGPHLALLDASGKPRAALVIAEDNPHLCLYDVEGKIRMHLSLRGQWPQLALGNRDPLAPTSLELTEGGTFLSLGHPMGGGRLFICCGPTGTGVELFPFGASMKRSARLSLARTGPVVTLNASTGGPRIEISVRGGKPVFAFLDKKGDRVLTLTVTGQKPTLRVQRANGTPGLVIPLEDLRT